MLISNKKMRHGNAASSHSGFIPLKLYPIRKKASSVCFGPIARKKNLISVCSAAFITISLFNLVNSYKCHDNFINHFINSFKSVTIPRSRRSTIYIALKFQ